MKCYVSLRNRIHFCLCCLMQDAVNLALYAVFERFLSEHVQTIASNTDPLVLLHLHIFHRLHMRFLHMMSGYSLDPHPAFVCLMKELSCGQFHFFGAK